MIVAHGGFDSSYEEFFPQMMYLRQLGYTVYLFEGPGQGACLRTDRRSPRHHPLRLWLADQSSVSVKKGEKAWISLKPIMSGSAGRCTC